jgi:hypothetical protein
MGPGFDGPALGVTKSVLGCDVPQALLEATEITPEESVEIKFMVLVVEVPAHPLG